MEAIKKRLRAANGSPLAMITTAAAITIIGKTMEVGAGCVLGSGSKQACSEPGLFPPNLAVSER